MERTTYKDISLPPFVANRHSLLRDNGRQIDWALVTDRFRAGSVDLVLTANAAADAVSITVSALKKPITKGQVFEFGGKKFARASDNVAAGLTTVPVEALGVALVTGDTAYYGGRGKKSIVPGTRMDLLASGKVIPSALGTGGVTCYSIIETGAAEDMPSDSMTGYGQFVSGNFFENMLPEGIQATWNTEMRNRGAHLQMLTYSDNT